MSDDQRLRALVGGRNGWGTSAAITLLAGVLRFVRLDQPASDLDAHGHNIGSGQVFDELYYACDAHSLMTYGVEHGVTDRSGNVFCHLTSAPSFVVHPPVGKLLIGLGEQAFGFNTFGWRFASAVFGTLTVLLVVRIGRRLTGSTLLGGLAGLLLCFDGLEFVQSRVALLDIFLCFFVTATFGALLLHRDHGGQRWRIAAGIMAGLAVGTKWSAIFPLAIMVMLTVAWEAKARGSWRVTFRRSTASVMASLVLLPLTVYVMTWTGWFMSKDGFDRQWATGRFGAVRSFWQYQKEILRFHDGLDAYHPYQSHPLSWPFLGRPVAYYSPPGLHIGEYGCTASQGCVREVLGIGTPAIWWLMIPVAIGLAARWISRRDWVSAALLPLMAVSILAWIPSDLNHRTMFLFYALPSIPFLCLGIALMFGWLLGKPTSPRRPWAAGALGVYVSLVVLNFAFLYPVLAAVTLPYSSWHERMWFPSWI